MNKRIAKKRYKKALNAMRHYIPGISMVSITNYIFVDKSGKECDPAQEDARYIKLRRPKIRYVKEVPELKDSTDLLCVGEIKEDLGTSSWNILLSPFPSPLHKELLERKKQKESNNQNIEHS